MLKRYFWLAIATVFVTFQLFVTNANALDLTKELRTLPLNDQGQTLGETQALLTKADLSVHRYPTILFVPIVAYISST